MARAADPSVEMAEESTLEHEFMLGEADAEGTQVGGFLNEDGTAVRELYAGMACFMR